MNYKIYFAKSSLFDLLNSISSWPLIQISKDILQIYANHIPITKVNKNKTFRQYLD